MKLLRVQGRRQRLRRWAYVAGLVSMGLATVIGWPVMEQSFRLTGHRAELDIFAEGPSTAVREMLAQVAAAVAREEIGKVASDAACKNDLAVQVEPVHDSRPLICLQYRGPDSRGPECLNRVATRVAEISVNRLGAQLTDRLEQLQSRQAVAQQRCTQLAKLVDWQDLRIEELQNEVKSARVADRGHENNATLVTTSSRVASFESLGDLLEQHHCSLSELGNSRQQVATLAAQLVTTTSQLDQLPATVLRLGPLHIRNVSMARWAFMIAAMVLAVGGVWTLSVPLRVDDAPVQTAVDARRDLGVPVTVVCTPVERRAA